MHTIKWWSRPTISIFLPCLLIGCSLFANREHISEGLPAADIWFRTKSYWDYSFPPKIITPSEQETATYIFQLRARVGAYLRAHPHLPEIQRSNLEAMQVMEGMNKEQVSLLCGTPHRIHSNPGRYQATEIWSYKFLKHEYQFFFREDMLTHVDHVYVESL